MRSSVVLLSAVLSSVLAVPQNNEPSTTTSSSASTSTSDACVTKCNADYNTCRSAPDANQASCAAQYSGCLGYVPFGSDGSLVTPTACSASAASTSTAPSTADGCVTKCNADYNTCRSAPDANQASCAAQYSGCLGYVPFGSDGSLITPTACSSAASATTNVNATPTAEACVTKCNADYNTCRSAPDANQASCAAQYSSCLGYVPFGSDGSLVTPTACSVAAATSSAAPSAPIAGGNVNGTASTTKAPVSPTSTPLQANGGSHFEHGLLGVFALSIAALLF